MNICLLYFLFPESGLLPKAKRKSGTSTTGRKEISPIYNKLIEVFECLAELVEKHTLTDTFILRVWSINAFVHAIVGSVMAMLNCLFTYSTYFIHMMLSSGYQLRNYSIFC